MSDDLQHLMAATHIATLFLDRNLHILRFTPQIGELFNLRLVDCGRPLSDLTHRLHYDGLIDDATQVLKSLIPMEREIADDKGNWYLATLRPYRTADERINGLVLTFVGITEHKEAEIALRSSEERYRALFESMGESFCVLERLDLEDGSVDFNILVANPAFSKLTGLRPEANRTLRNLAPDQLPFWKMVYERIDVQSTTVRFECFGDGFNCWLEVSSFRLPSIYGPHVAILMKDINAQKRIELALRDASQRDAFRVALADALRSAHEPQDIYQTSCRMLADHLAVSRVIYRDETLGKEVETDNSMPGHFRPWEGNAELCAEFMRGKILSNENTFESTALTFKQRNVSRLMGVQAFVSVPLRDKDKIIAVMSVLNASARTWSTEEIELIKEVAERTLNAVERMHAENAIRQRELALRQMDHRKNEFLAMLSHELRNPLAPILNALHIIENSGHGSPQSEAATAVMRRQVGLMSRLIDDLLDVTRISRGKIQLQSEPLELNQLIGNTLTDHSSLFQHNNITLEFLPAEHAIWVDGDSNRLSQTVGNLLQNCVKFTESGGKATVSLGINGQQAVVRVVDSGVGMDKELIARLFQPFTQGSATLDRSKGGLGLGLALSKRLIELHEGTIVANSDGPGEGATFEIVLPLATPPGYAYNTTTTTNHQAKHRILIIEDNVDSANTLRDVLNLVGHDVNVAYDSTTGLQCAQEFNPDIIICDIGLPGIDGYEMARRFRADEKYQDVTLVALSGYAMPEDRKRASAAGFDYHLAKPADIEKLLTICGA